MNPKHAKWVIVAACMVCATVAHPQVFSNKEVGKKNAALVDSLKQSEYPYALPIWGDKATKRGYSLPYSAGLSMQYFGQKSDIKIDNLLVGFNNGPMYNLDGLVRFDKAEAITNTVSLRPDIWLLPFLNIYGIFSGGKGSTEVGYSLWLPDTTGTERPVLSLNSKVEFNTATMGFGFTPTLGVGGGWLALDMNFAWTDVPQLDEPAFTFIFDPRIGKTFQLRNPDENINVWAGGFRVELSSGTTGSIPLGDVLPIDQWQSSVDQAEQGVQQRYQENEAWWASLSAQERADPVNKAKYEATKAALDRAAAAVEAAGQAVNSASSSTVEYSISKAPKDPWNLIVGGQYQLNKSWMFRVEVGGLTSRTQVIAGVQFRFGL